MTQYIYYDLPINQIIYIAENHGIRIFNTYTENTRLLGYYSKKHRRIIMYNMPQYTYQYTDTNEETLKHELVHAIQHCKGNYTDYVLVTDDNKIKDCILNKKIDKQFIDFYSPKKLRVFEYEAYCLENQVSYKFLGEQIEKYCK